MKFVVDQQLPPLLCDWICNRGHEAVHTDRIGLGQAPDVEIASLAQRIGAVVVTRDKDFVGLSRRGESFKIIIVRLGNCANEALIATFEAVWPKAIARLESGEGLIEIA